MSNASKIFTGYRALGFVSTDTPLVCRYQQREKENYVVTSVGKAFHTYNCSRLGLVSVSDAHPGEIRCLASDAKYVFTSCGKVIRAFKRGRKAVHVYEGHSNEVHLLLPFGQHLISCDVNSVLRVWDIESTGDYLEMTFDNASFEISAMLHPNTYVNKIVIGSTQGISQLWNLRVDKLIYTFKSWNSAIMVLEQAPAVDIIAYGLADGRVILHNLKLDETLMTFTQEWGPVTSVSFRTDGQPMMVTGSTAGHIALWDLQERKLKSQMRDVHKSAVTGMRCLPSEPLMVTSSADNTLKIWIFDQPDGGGRLVRFREGHKAPPTYIRHYGTNGKTVVSAGQDSLMLRFSTVHDRENKSMGRASYNKKKTKKSGLKHDQYMMPAVTNFAAEPCRESDWDSIVACHRGERIVSTWNFQKSTMGKYKFDHDRFNNPLYHRTTAEAVEITPCGNFALIGYSSGHVDVYNLQSGIFRGSFGDPLAHEVSIRGIAVDGLNQVAVTAGSDSQLKFWKFKTRALLGTLKLKSSISRILLHRESAMLAVSMDDYSVVVVDTDTRRDVRHFTGHTNTITDMTFSPDGRWLVTTSMDCSVRTWDLPTGKLIDSFLVDAAVTSLTLSPTCDFLATTHVDDLGVYLWSNMTLYSYVSLQPLPANYEPKMIATPGTSRRHTDESKMEETDDVEEYERSEFKSPAQISDELVTLSLLPNSRWQNLLNLDVIRQRNKPKQPPKAPKAAPFFLPTLPGLQPKFAQVPDEKAKLKEGSRILSGVQAPLSPLAQLLVKAGNSSHYLPVMEYLKSLGPSAIDIEIRSLDPSGGGTIAVMLEFMKFITHTLESHADFEIVQAYLGLFLKLNAETISESPKLVEAAQSLMSSHTESWRKMEDLFTQSLCLVTYLRSATV